LIHRYQGGEVMPRYEYVDHEGHAHVVTAPRYSAAKQLVWDIEVARTKSVTLAEFVGTTLAIMLGDAAEVHPLRNGGAMLVIGPATWAHWKARAETFRADSDPPDHPF
jgi:hypothetical protein